jgi:hypothetical protein
VDAIKLTGHKPAAEATIWVDPSGYRPARLTGPVQLISGGTDKQTAPIPSGFREVCQPAPKAPVTG